MACLLLALALAQAPVETGGQARPDTVKVLLNGSWDVAWAAESGEFRDWATLGAETGANAFLNGVVRLDVKAVLQENVDVHASIQNARFDVDDAPADDTAEADDSDERLNLGQDSGGQTVELKELYVAVKSFLHANLSLKLGLQEAVLDLRKTGHPLLLALGRAEGPWDDLAQGSVFEGVVRNENGAAGVKVSLDRTNLSLEFGFFQVDDNGAHVTDHERVFYAVASFDAAEEAKISIVAAWFNGLDSGDEIRTLGAQASVRVARDASLFGEYYVQSGDADRSAGVDQDARAWQVGGRVDFKGTLPAWVELSVARIDGDDPSSADSEEFLSYENDDDMVILSSNEWGLDLDSDIRTIKLKGAVDVAIGGGPQTLRLTGKLALAEPVEKANWAGQDTFGREFDLTVEYRFHANAAIYLTVAQLSGSDAFEMVGSGGHDSARMILLGSYGSF